MKHLKTLVLAKSIAAALIASAGIAAPTLSHAGAAEGFTCASDHPAQFANGVFKCHKPDPQTRRSVCLPTLTLSTISVDTCRVPNSPPEVPAVSLSFAELVATDLVVPHDSPVRSRAISPATASTCCSTTTSSRKDCPSWACPT